MISRGIGIRPNLMTSILEETQAFGSSNIRWYGRVGSTMDVARECIKNNTIDLSKGVAAIVADEQSSGRGTRGRTWASGSRNLFITVIVPLSALPIPLYLVPLQVGNLLHKVLSPYITPPSTMTLKWPNDVLIDGAKCSGTLVETEGQYLLIGSGVNVLAAPPVLTTGPNAGRVSTSLADHSQRLSLIAEASKNAATKNAHEEEAPLDTVGSVDILFGPLDVHRRIAARLVEAYEIWLSTPDTKEVAADKVRSLYTAELDCSDQVLRDQPAPYNVVKPLGINPDGTLRVQYKHNQEIIVLAAEYLY